MVFTDSQRAAAKDELGKSKLKYFCFECGRPRKLKYCPWNSAHPKEFHHVVMLRSSISIELQVRLFLSNSKDVSTRHVFVEG